MGYIERIQSDLTAAMKEKDELRLSVLRMVKSALKNKEIEKMRPLDDLESLQVLQTLVKQRRESVDQFTQGGRHDLAEKETKEIAIIEEYLPAAPSDAEIRQAVEAAIAEEGADSLKQMGAVIKAARARLEGKAIDGKALSDRVRERLARKILTSLFSAELVRCACQGYLAEARDLQQPTWRQTWPPSPGVRRRRRPNSAPTWTPAKARANSPFARWFSARSSESFSAPFRCTWDCAPGSRFPPPSPSPSFPSASCAPSAAPPFSKTTSCRPPARPANRSPPA